MIQLTATPPARRRRWLPLGLISVVLHGIVLASSRPGPWAVESLRARGPVRVRLILKAPRRPAPAPQPAPQQVKPPPAKAPPPRKRVGRERHTRESTRPAPRPQPAPLEPRFGVPQRAVVQDGSGPVLALGDTLAAELQRGPRTPTWAGHDAPRATPRPAVRPEQRRRAPVPLYKLTLTPRFAHKVLPRYPRAAREQGIQGTVLLQALIDAAGKVREVKVLRSPHATLAAAAEAALRASRLEPGMVGQRPVPVKLKIPYHFLLEG